MTFSTSSAPSSPPRVLTIAGSDSGGGAGIQADLKTLSALGCYGMSAITAVTAQNTTEVRGVYPLTPRQVGDQIRAVLDDLGADAIKIGMLFSPEIIKETARCLKEFSAPNVVLDPVMIAKSGDRLLQDEAAEALVEELFPLATVITPNIPEAVALARLSGRHGSSEIALTEYTEHPETTEDPAAFMEPLARTLQTMGAASVVMKGGHLEGIGTTDLLFHLNDTHRFDHPRVDTKNTHGTGCTYSSAIASFLARGLDLPRAVQRSNQWLYGAILSGADRHLGHGHGPVHHFYKMEKIFSTL